MAKQNINIGTADKGNGDPLRVAFNKINQNFTELYSTGGTADLGKFIFDSDGDSAFITTTDDAGASPDRYDIVLVPSGEGYASIRVPNYTNTLAGDPVRISNMYENGSVAIETNSGNFTFDSNGNLTFPQGTVFGYTEGGDFAIDGAVDKYISIYTHGGADSYGWTFGTGGKLTLPGFVEFPDSSIQETAYRYSASDTAPTMTTGALWFNTEEGKLYVNYNNVWTDANPTEIDPSAIRFNNLNQIELPDGGDIVDSLGNSVLGGTGSGDSLVNGDSSFSVSSDGTLTLTHPDEPNYHPLSTTLTIQKAAGNYHTISGAYGLSLQATPVPSGYGLNTNTNFVDIFHDGVSVNVNDNTWGFGTDGNLTLPNGMSIDSYSTLGVNAIVTIGGDNTRIIIDNNGAPPGFSIVTDAANASHTWRFGPDGDLTFPDATVQTTAWTGITGFGEGFSLTAADKIVTNKLYSTNETQSTQHYRLELDTNGVVVLPDQSIINGSTLRGIYGTGEANYTGITIGPDANHREESWVWVDHTGVSIATEYSTSAYTWKFDNDGDLTLPTGGEIKTAAGTGDVVIEANNGTARTWTFGGDGILSLPDFGAAPGSGDGAVGDICRNGDTLYFKTGAGWAAIGMTLI